MKIICVGYRTWALNIYDELARKISHPLLIMRSKEQYQEDLIFDFKPDLVLYYGWSWHVSDRIVEEFTCVMLHPSRLPEYRGGSPIQNQIKAGLLMTKATLFLMSKKMDAGPIINTAPLSLKGDMPQIFAALELVGLKMTLEMIDNGCSTHPQVEEDATYFSRLNPNDSEITLKDFETSSGVDLYNKIRMLTGPYPRAFFRTTDGKLLIFDKVRLADFSQKTHM